MVECDVANVEAVGSRPIIRSGLPVESQKKHSFIHHPFASIAQWLVRLTSNQRMTVRFRLLAQLETYRNEGRIV